MIDPGDFIAMRRIYDFIFKLDEQLGRLATPVDLLEAARPRESEVHDFFEWKPRIHTENNRMDVSVSYLYLARRKAYTEKLMEMNAGRETEAPPGSKTDESMSFYFRVLNEGEFYSEKTKHRRACDYARTK